MRRAGAAPSRRGLVGVGSSSRKIRGSPDAGCRVAHDISVAGTVDSDADGGIRSAAAQESFIDGCARIARHDFGDESVGRKRCQRRRNQRLQRRGWKAGGRGVGRTRHIDGTYVVDRD